MIVIAYFFGILTSSKCLTCIAFTCSKRPTVQSIWIVKWLTNDTKPRIHISSFMKNYMHNPPSDKKNGAAMAVSTDELPVWEIIRIHKYKYHTNIFSNNLHSRISCSQHEIKGCLRQSVNCPERMRKPYNDRALPLKCQVKILYH